MSADVHPVEHLTEHFARAAPTKAEWERIKPAVRRLYVVEKRPLRDVVYTLDQQYGFRATQRMFKSRIRQWEFNKNTRGEDWAALAILYKTRQDARKQSTEFLVHGKKKDLLRHIKSRNMTEDEFLAAALNTSSQSRNSQSHDDVPTPSTRITEYSHTDDTRQADDSAEDSDEYIILPHDTAPFSDAFDLQCDQCDQVQQDVREMAAQLVRPMSLMTTYATGDISSFQLVNATLATDSVWQQHKSQNVGSATAESPNVWETIKQFLNSIASTSSKTAKATGKLVPDGVASCRSGTQHLKKVLPMFINGSRYNTTPDTGSLENAISADEARRLGLKITGKGREFLMGNGSKTISLGIVRLKCAFALGDPHVAKQWFNVIENLAVPVIIGKKFLDISKTLTLHQHRLQAVWTTAKKAFRVMHLNRPRQLMRCYVNGKLVRANPDTGSEVDLMSPSYARENSLKIEALDEGEDWVQFADGSIAKLLGKTQVEFDVYDGRYRSPTGYIGHSRTFYLLEGLSTDVLLGEEALYEMNIFAEHDDSFVDVDNCRSCIEMNLITWFDKRARQMSDALVALSSASSKPMTHSEAQNLLSKLDARELHQREMANRKLAALPAAERPAQERLEEARRRDYDNARAQLVQRRNAAAHGSN